MGQPWGRVDVPLARGHDRTERRDHAGREAGAQSSAGVQR